jgi:hypothetical protein
MVEAVGSVSFSPTFARQAVPGAVSIAVSATPLPDISPIASGIRVDNLRNVAILEYRSVKTGEVVRQYPSEAQIAAFRQAEKLQSDARQAHRHEETVAAAESVQQHSVPQSSPAPVSAPVPVQTSAPTGSDSSATHSVLV